MGVGKSTVGRRLAARLGVPFVDADHEIEIAADMSVAEIFEKFGEPYFRDGERRVIARLVDGKPQGDRDRRRRVHQRGDARADPGAGDRDLARCPGRRAGRARQAPRHAARCSATATRIKCSTELAAVRNPIYAQAPIRIASDQAPHESTVVAILKAIGWDDA